MHLTDFAMCRLSFEAEVLDAAPGAEGRSLRQQHHHIYRYRRAELKDGTERKQDEGMETKGKKTRETPT
jgi:hypothetical protein